MSKCASPRGGDPERMINLYAICRASRPRCAGHALRESGRNAIIRFNLSNSRYRPRGMRSPSFARRVTLFERRGRREDRVPTCTRGPSRKKVAQRREDHRYRRNHTGLPCAMVYGLYVLSPVTGLFCHRHRRDAEHHRRLSASVGAPGPHDFAVRITSFV